MRRFIGAALVLCLAACDEASGPTESTSGGKKTYRFAMVPKMRNNPVFNYAKIAAEHRAKELGNVEILWRGPEKGDPIEQAQIVEQLVSLKVDGISISCNEAEPLHEPINKAVAAGIPVICFDSDSPKSKRKYIYGTDDIKAGEILAKEVARLIGGKGEIAILSGFSGADNLNRRIKGAEEYLAKSHPDIKVVNKVYCNDDIAKAIDDIKAYMQVKPGLAAWLMVGGWPLFGTNALDGVDPAKTKVVAFDALPQEWQYLENGKCAALVTQDLWGWGEKSVDILIALSEKKEWAGADSAGLIAAPNEVLTKETLPEYKGRWKSWFGE
ncbi:MAG: substrate-binding domain-containing protein [Planctomycetes bacterium]|nr:substrate-binding domain-containing protein [Planctomycetota bacterium]